MSCLVILSGRTKGRTFQVSPDRDNVVGRVNDCEVCIVDPRISRRHCVISAGQTGYVIKDLGSSNGIFVNDAKVVEGQIQDGDKLRLGLTELEFHQTERFEDAETKRMAPGETAPPDLGKAGPKPPEGAEARPLEFCARCSGSIPAPDLASGKARKVKGELVCKECMAKELAAADAAAVVATAGERAEDSKEGTSAEEVSRLAAELAESEPAPAELQKPSGAKEPAEAGKPAPPEPGESAKTKELPEAEKPAEDEAPAEPEEPAPAEEAVPVEVEEEADDYSTDALLIPEGAFDEPKPAEDASEKEEAGEEAKEAAKEEAEAPKPEEAESAEAEPEEAEPEKPKPPKAKPAKAKPPKARPAKAKPVRAEPEKAKPVAAEPVKAEPVAAEPEGAEPVKPAEVAEEAEAEKVTEPAEAAEPAAADLYDEALLEPEEVVELDDDGLPKLPDEKKGSSFDEDAKTPRPGPEIQVL